MLPEQTSKQYVPLPIQSKCLLSVEWSDAQLIVMTETDAHAKVVMTQGTARRVAKRQSGLLFNFILGPK